MGAAAACRSMHGDEGFYWVKTQKKRFYERTMPEERKQRVKTRVVRSRRPS